MRARVVRCTGPIAAGLLALCACSDDAGTGGAVASQLTRGLDFPTATILNGPIVSPPTAPDATILPLGGDAVARPGTAGIMSLEIDDPQGRAPRAALMQFPGDDSHMHVPDGGDDDVVDMPFAVPEEICEGLCNTYYAIELLVSVELEGGGVAPAVPQIVIIDCTEHGDPDACDEDDPGGGISEGLVCGPLSEGRLVLSGIPALDRYFDAVRQVDRSSDHALRGLARATTALATALGLPEDASSAAVGAALAAQIDASTQGGVNATIGERGCGVVSDRSVATLESCEPEATPPDAVECLGECEPAGAHATCPTGTTSGCHGLVQATACGGTCIGACTTTLMAPMSCDGTCAGACTGSCPDDGMGGCEGPCSGDCTGTCTGPSTGSCSEECSGLCSEATEAECSGSTKRTCTAVEAPAACDGVCYDEPSLPDASALCALDALSMARLFPECDRSLVQLSFVFAEGLTTSEETAFAALTGDLAAPLGALVDAIARAETVALAASDLETAATGLAQDAVDAAIVDPPEGSDPICAEEALLDAAPLLGESLDALGAALNAASALLGTPIVVAE